MATQLDLDDVVAGNPLAKQELLELRQDIERLKVVAKKAYWHAYEYARTNPDYNKILPVWNRFKLGYKELD